MSHPALFSNLFPFWSTFLSELRASAYSAKPGQPPLFSPHARVSDLLLALLVALALIVLRFVLERRILPHLLRRMAPVRRRKTSENIFYAGFYLVTFSIGLYVTMNEEWGYRYFDNGATVDSLVGVLHPPISDLFRLFYITQFGFYLGCMVFVLFVDGRRSDFMQYVIHHTVTLTLVALSYFMGYHRIGLYIVNLHDFSDISLYSAKAVHYLELHPWDTIVFVIFAVSFYVTRMIMLPRLIWGLVVDPYVLTVQKVEAIRYWAVYVDQFIIYWVFFLILLGVLQVLHCFWFSLVLKVIYGEVFGTAKIKTSGDVRSDSEDD